MDARNDNLPLNVNIGFELSRDVVAPAFRAVHETTLRLTIIIMHDDNIKSKKLALQILNPYTHPYYNLGLLSQRSIDSKFGTEESRHNLSQTAMNGNDVTITYRMPSSDTDWLLQFLSVLDDAIEVLKKNNLEMKFNILDVIKKLEEGYKKDDGDCACATMLNQLSIFMTNHPDISHHDAILLHYCFSRFFPLDSRYLTMMGNEIFQIIDAIFSKPIVNLIELNEFLKRVNLWQRIKLYRPCLGTAYDDDIDNNTDRWEGAEWYFLRDAKFTLSREGNMEIDTSENSYFASGYKTCILQNNLQLLAPHINLFFSEGVKWDEKIIFTPECSQRLADMKLHFDVDNIKKLLKARNHCQFFQQAYQPGSDFRENLPEETVTLIFSLAYETPILSTTELVLPKNQAHVL